MVSRYLTHDMFNGTRSIILHFMAVIGVCEVDFCAFLLQDRNSKPVRSLSGSLPTMGPGMMPHHNYAIPADNYHSGGRLAYRPALGQLIGQSIPMGARVPLTNDMGPPIFMPCELPTLSQASQMMVSRITKVTNCNIMIHCEQPSQSYAD